MRNIALDIKQKDWVYILVIGVVLGVFLSSFGYLLVELSFVDGALFGVILGFDITLLSLIFITFTNTKLLPNIKKIYWAPLSALFSFLSGFLGSLIGTKIAEFFSIQLVYIFHDFLYESAAFIGLLTYIVGVLLYRFVVMRNEKELIDNAYIKSRLSSLETQLNPHFLFNALNSIAELIHQNPQEAENAILKVSSFLRNTMDEKALVELKKELRNVEDYVELENIRFSGRIKLHMPKQIPSWHVPKFSIQLIVENAMKHGLKTKKEELNITITCPEKERIIEIKNDGEPMKSTNFGIGLSNLKQRLELLCGGYIEITNKQEPTFIIYLGECNENNNS
ncbi:MAG: histidine kinase [Sulfurimonadaceae bacterium]|jgi:sensor histidine kinase YesM|nr:histidine kinase [Sulfurimonadaceae bacterium]